MPGRQFSTHTNTPEVIDALHDGVPPWMQNSLRTWVKARISPNGRLNADVGLIRRLERLLRTDLTGNQEAVSRIFEVFMSRYDNNPELALDIVDGILQLESNMPSASQGILELILEESGSKWRVVFSRDGHAAHLEERVDASVVSAIEAEVESQTDAAPHLARAWNLIFGRNPDPSSAYSSSIKAIEAACWPIITPNDHRATLGRMMGELRAHPELLDTSIHEPEVAANTDSVEPSTGVQSVIKQMELVWNGQTDRHGTSNPVTPSLQSAEQAVIIALSLCHQFSRGLITRASA